MTAKNKVDKASQYAHVLDEETQATLNTVRSKNSKAVRWFIVCWTILFLLAVGGIYKQTQIATQSKEHIDCIVKLFSTPTPPTSRTKFITDAYTTCNIKFQ